LKPRTPEAPPQEYLFCSGLENLISPRKTAVWDAIPEAMTRELALAQLLLTQQRTGSHKLYSLHAPEVQSISKGKAHKRSGFGVKVGVVASLKKPFLLATHALPGRPYDGKP
jgi:hypothetical protein